jgi:hypothetical protein
VETRGQIDSAFDGIAYGKTSAVLHMLESYLGPETLRAGVNLYLKEHAYGNAMPPISGMPWSEVPINRSMRSCQPSIMQAGW